MARRVVPVVEGQLLDDDVQDSACYTPSSPDKILRKPQNWEIPPTRSYEQQHSQAAVKLQSRFRGGIDRSATADRYFQSGCGGASQIEPMNLGLGPYAETHATMPRVEDNLRYRVRDETISKVWPQLGFPLEQLPHQGRSMGFEEIAGKVLQEVISSNKASLPKAVQKQLQTVKYFVDSEQPNREAGPLTQQGSGFIGRTQECYLLGQFDCLAVPARADYDACFRSLETDALGHHQHAHPAPVLADCDGPEGFTGWFWVVHVAAPNIGESTQAEDFVAYSEEEHHAPSPPLPTSTHVGSTSRCCWKQQGMLSRPTRRLNQDLYVHDMGRIWRNSLLAMGHLGVQEAVFFPLGMGAFLRKLSLNDDRYAEPRVLLKLRRRVAGELMNAIAETCIGASSKGPRHVHLCLVCMGAEAIDNHNCFLEAAAAKLRECPKLMDVLKLRQNVDSLQLAAKDLAPATKDGRSAPKVGILNGANRKLIGNHWFQTGARLAIDENFHRRSASMARAALLLNFDFEARARKPLQLRENLSWLGGQVVSLQSGKLLNSGKASQGAAGSAQRPSPVAGNNGSCMCCARRKPKDAQHGEPKQSAGNSKVTPTTNGP